MNSMNVFVVCASVFMMLLLSCEAVQLTEAEKATMLQKHNQARCSVSPTASKMPRLVWDSKLAQVAQRYADSCPGYAHNALRSQWYQEVGGSGYIGENLAWGYNSAGEATDAWINEKLHYHYQIFDTSVNAAGCDTGDWTACGHYTQIIWASTTLVGCARTTSVCGNIGGGDWFYVCNYASGGNFVGQFPYVSGTGVTTDACSSLTSTDTNNNNNNVKTCRTTAGNYVSSGVIEASSSSPTTSPALISDNNYNTYWAPATSDPNEWIRVALDGSFLVSKVSIMFRDMDHTPRSVVLMSKADASSVFTTVKTWTIAATNTNAKAVVSFTTPIKSIAFRVKILATGTKKTQISEFIIDATESC